MMRMRGFGHISRTSLLATGYLLLASCFLLLASSFQLSAVSFQNGSFHHGDAEAQRHRDTQNYFFLLSGFGVAPFCSFSLAIARARSITLSIRAWMRGEA